MNTAKTPEGLHHDDDDDNAVLPSFEFRGSPAEVLR